MVEGGQRALGPGAKQLRVDAGGRDYRALVGLGTLRARADDLEAAERYFLLAEAVFPGYDTPEFSAERKLVELYEKRGDGDAAMAARQRWLAWNAGVYDERVKVAEWHVEHGRLEDACRMFAEANEVDPFRRDLHVAWGDALRWLERFEDALLEYRVARLVPSKLDRDHLRVDPRVVPSAGPNVLPPPPVVARLPPEALIDEPLTAAERGELLALTALCFKQLGREQESREAAARALELDPDNERARELW